MVQHAATTVDAWSEAWIGWTFPPPPRAMAEAGWRPDDRDAYCHRCGDSVGPGEATDAGCGTCRPRGELPGGLAGGVVRLGVYVEPLRGWIHAIKFQRWTEMAEALGGMLGRAVAAADVIELDRAVIVPMAVPWQRRLNRGVDHAGEIARAVARELDAPTAGVLRRANHPPQATLTASERKRGGSRGLRIARRLGGWRVQDLEIIVVDDVRTTGATLRSACRLIRTLKPRKIVCAVVAVSDSAARRARAQQAGAKAGSSG